jgi:hypothetical protein
MTLPSTAAIPPNKTLHQNFADIFSLPAVRNDEAGLVWISRYDSEIAATNERVFLMETNAVIVWQQCEIKSTRGDGAAATVTSHVVIEEGFAAVQESGSGPIAAPDVRDGTSAVGES